MAKIKNKTQAPKLAGYDQGPRDFFRGSNGMNKSLKNNQNKFNKPRDFTGFRRGSR